MSSTRNQIDRFSFVRSPTPSNLTQFASGGLILLSRFPIAESNELTFSGGSRFLTSGFRSADGLAAKGALHARVLVGEQKRVEIDCYLTHLESYSRSIRRKQIQELSDFIHATRFGDNPILVFGDLNPCGPKSDAKPDVTSGIEYLEYEFLCGELAGDNLAIGDVAIANQSNACGTRMQWRLMAGNESTSFSSASPGE